MPLIDKLGPILLKSLSDEQYTSVEYIYILHRRPDLRNPRTLSEKIQWIKLHYRNRLLIQCTDKLLVRDYVRSVLSEEVLVPLLGIYDRPEDIPYDALPDQFILKTTHGSGWNIICRSKSTFNRQAAAVKLSKWLRSNFYDYGREWAYKEIRPRIVCEALLLDDRGNFPLDHKMYCFHGEPRFVQVDYDRFTGHKRNLYDLDWHRIPCRFQYPNNEKASPSPPGVLKELLSAARKLSSPFPFMRVDLLVHDQRVWFGELTCYPERGMGRFFPPSYDLTFGDYLDLGRLQ